MPATGAQVTPPSALSQATPAWTVTVRLGLPVTLVVTASPAIRISFPAAATDLMSSAWPLPAARRSRAASSRSQLVPLADRKISGVDLAASPPGTLAPTAMNPCAVLATALTRSPGRSGIPLPGASVQVRPSGLVQIEPGPRATHAPWPPATKMAPCPGGGTPPAASLTVPIVQVRPSSRDTKNCARGMRVPACDPTATISSPTLVTRPSVWVMPRPPPAAVKSLPARVAGGKPSEAADGVGPALPLFAPAITTTATPKTTMARIGIATLIPQPRNSRPAANSRDQRRLTGWGRSERSRPGPLGAGRPVRAVLAAAGRAAGERARLVRGERAGRVRRAGGPGLRGRAGWRRERGAGPGRLAEFEPGRDEHVVGPGLRRGLHRHRLAHRRRVPEPARLGGLRAGVRPGDAPVAGLARRGTAGRAGLPGAAALELEPGRRPAPRIVVGLAVADRDARDGPGGRSGEGAGSGTRRPGARGSRRAPGAVSRGMAGRFPCHLCLAVSVIFPADGPRSCTASGGLNRGNHMPLPPMLPAGTGRDRDFPLRRGPEGRRVTQATSAPPGACGSSGPGLDGGR